MVINRDIDLSLTTYFAHHHTDLLPEENKEGWTATQLSSELSLVHSREHPGLLYSGLVCMMLQKGAEGTADDHQGSTEDAWVLAHQHG